jgi:uncharacterized protein (DUF2236 family)
MGGPLHEIHKGFKGFKSDGQQYYALEPEAYAWVHATLLDAYVTGHAYCGRPMTLAQVECFYEEYRGLGRFVGVREDELPADWDGFRAYFDDVVATQLEHTESVDRVLRSINEVAIPRLPDPIVRALPLPARRLVYLGGVGLLPQTLRDRCKIRWTRREEREFRAIGAVARRMTPVMPKHMLISGPTQLRWRRGAIARGPLGPGREASGEPLVTAA